MHARRMFAVVVTLLGSAWLLPAQAGACLCAPPPAVEVARETATAVFEGEVVALEHDAARSTTTSLTVLRAWKGTLPAQVRVVDDYSRGDCGFGFTPGETYLVYADGEIGALSASICSRTARSDAAAADLTTLGPGKPPTAAEPPSEPAEPAKQRGCSIASGAFSWPWSIALLALRRRRSS